MHAFRGVVPNDKRFLGGETIGELFDRVAPGDRAARRRPDGWDTALVVAHGAVNRAILSYALTGRADVPRPLRAGAGLPQRARRRGRDGEWIVRAVNVAASDLVHRSTRQTTMEQYWAQYRAAARAEPGTPDRRAAEPRRPTTLPSCPAHFSFDTGWNAAVRELRDPLALDRQLVAAARPLPVARAAGTGSPRSRSGTPSSATRASGSCPPCTCSCTKACATATPYRLRPSVARPLG